MHHAARPMTRTLRIAIAAAEALALAASAFARAAMRKTLGAPCVCAPLLALAPEFSRAPGEPTRPWRGVMKKPPQQRPDSYG